MPISLSEEIKKRGVNQAGYLFKSQKGGSISTTHAHRRFKRSMEISGVYRKGLSLHSLRHFYATNCLEQGLSLTYVRDALGHSNISVTSVYLSFTGTDIDKARLL